MTQSRPTATSLILLLVVFALFNHARCVVITLHPDHTSQWDGNCSSGTPCNTGGSSCGIAVHTTINTECEIVIMDGALSGSAVFEANAPLKVSTGGRFFNSTSSLEFISLEHSITFDHAVFDYVIAPFVVNSTLVLIEESEFNVAESAAWIKLAGFNSLKIINTTMKRTVETSPDSILSLSPGRLDRPDLNANVEVVFSGSTFTGMSFDLTPLISYDASSPTKVSSLIIGNNTNIIASRYTMNICPEHVRIEDSSISHTSSSTSSIFDCLEENFDIRFFEVFRSSLTLSATNPSAIMSISGAELELFRMEDVETANLQPGQFQAQHASFIRTRFSLGTELGTYFRISPMNTTSANYVEISESYVSDYPLDIIGCYNFDEPSCLTNLVIDKLPNDAPPIRVALSGAYNMVRTTTIDTLEISSDTDLSGLNITGGILEVKTSITGMYNSLYLSGQGQLKLWSVDFESTEGPFVRGRSDSPIIHFPYGTTGIIHANNSINYMPIPVAIDLAPPSPDYASQLYSSDLPDIGVPYPLFDFSVSDPVNYAFALDPQYNITGFQNETYEFLHWTLNEVECNQACNPAGLIADAQCKSRITCPCANFWRGPLCDCNSLSLPQGISCSEQGGNNWEVNTDFQVLPNSFFNLPQNTTLLVHGNVQFDGRVTINDGSKITSTGTSTQNGRMEIVCKLREERSPNGCHVLPSVTVKSQNLVFTDVTEIFITFDVSALSTDGSCPPQSFSPSATNPFDLNALFSSISSSAMASGATWNVTFILPEGSKRSTHATTDEGSSYAFNVTLLSAGGRNVSSGTPTRLTSSGPTASSCSSFTSAPGTLSLFVGGCQAEPNVPPDSPAAKSSKVLWWYYTIPIIAVVLIVILVVVLVFTVPSIRDKVLPYHKSGY